MYSILFACCYLVAHIVGIVEFDNTGGNNQANETDTCECGHHGGDDFIMGDEAQCCCGHDTPNAYPQRLIFRVFGEDSKTAG